MSGPKRVVEATTAQARKVLNAKSTALVADSIEAELLAVVAQLANPDEIASGIVSRPDIQAAEHTEECISIWTTQLTADPRCSSARRYVSRRYPWELFIFGLTDLYRVT